MGLSGCLTVNPNLFIHQQGNHLVILDAFHEEAIIVYVFSINNGGLDALLFYLTIGLGNRVLGGRPFRP